MNGQVSVWFASVVLGVCVFLATVAGWGIGAWQRRTSWEEEEELADLIAFPRLGYSTGYDGGRFWTKEPGEPRQYAPGEDWRAQMTADLAPAALDLGDGTPPLLVQPPAGQTPAQRRRAKHKRRGPYAPQGEYLETALTWQARQAMAAREVREWVAGEMAFLVEVRLPRWLDWSDLEGA